MTRLSCLSLLAATALLAASASAQDIGVTMGGPHFGDMEVLLYAMPVPDPDVRTMDGYVEYRICLVNRSSTDDHEVRLILPAETRGESYDNIWRNARTVRVARGSTVNVSIFQPALPLAGDGMAVEIDGKRAKATVAVPFSGGYPPYYYYGYGGGRGQLPILASRAVPETFRDEIRTKYPEYGFLRSELPVGDWSDNWLGYGRFRGVLLTEEEANQLPQPVLLALRRHAECGGVVVVQGRSVPTELTEGQPDQNRYHVGFGVVAVSGAGNDAAGWSRLAAAWGDIPFDERPPRMTYGGSRGSWEELKVPVRWLFVVMLIFAIGIGPVNLFLLARRKKRMWLWWNVPLASLVTCLGIFTYSMASEGFSGRMRTYALTVLNENTHRALTIGYLSVYSPFTPSGGLKFDYQTEVSPVLDSYNPFGGRGRSVDWTNCQQFESGWVVARSPAHFVIRKNEDRRERVGIHRDSDGAVKAVNALGVGIRQLYYCDSDGRLYSLKDLPAGGEATLEATGRSSAPPMALRDLYKDNSQVEAVERMAQRPRDFLAPGCYVAVCEKPVFVETPLDGAREENGLTVVYGISASQDQSTEAATKAGQPASAIASER